jgi:hypothetical protein
MGFKNNLIKVMIKEKLVHNLSKLLKLHEIDGVVSSLESSPFEKEKLDLESFLKRVEPYLLSEDKCLQRFGFRVLDHAYLATEKTYLMGLEANDRAEHRPGTNTILPYLLSYPLNDEILSLLIERFKAGKGKEDQTESYFIAQLINQIDSCLMSRHESELLKIYSKEVDLSPYIQLCGDTLPVLFQKLEETARKLDSAEKYDNELFYYGHLIVKSLVQKGPLDSREICRVIEEGRQNELLPYKTILYTCLAGELKLSQTVPAIVDLLVNHPDDDVFTDVATEALVEIGTEEVVKALQPIIFDDNVAFFVIDILKKIKLEQTEAVLIQAFDEAERLDIKTLLAKALCEQLSKVAISKIESLIEEGYAEDMTDLVEPLYCNCVVNGVAHPKLEEWQQAIEEKRLAQLQRQAELDKMTKENSLMTKSKPKVQGQGGEIGRNEPCPCGSGKKYKKCCG